MPGKSTAAHLPDYPEEDFGLETERLALLHQVESRIRARFEARKHIPYRTSEAVAETPKNEGILENQIAELLVAKSSPETKTRNIASKISDVRNLIETHVDDDSGEL